MSMWDKPWGDATRNRQYAAMMRQVGKQDHSRPPAHAATSGLHNSQTTADVLKGNVGFIHSKYGGAILNGFSKYLNGRLHPAMSRQQLDSAVSSYLNKGVSLARKLSGGNFKKQDALHNALMRAPDGGFSQIHAERKTKRGKTQVRSKSGKWNYKKK